MQKIKLKERQYLGEGYLHFFRNIETGAVLVEECTKREYERMGEKNGAQYNPTKEGYRWIWNCQV